MESNKEQRPKKEHVVTILNGTKVWLSAIAFLFVHGAAGVWWASSLNTTVKMGFSNVKADIATVDKKVDKLADTVESNRKEAKDDYNRVNKRK